MIRPRGFRVSNEDPNRIEKTLNPELTPEALQRLADEDLMTLVEHRNADAFAVLYDRHGGAAFSLAHRIVGDRILAEDVSQEAFLSVWRSGARFDAARGSVRSWTLGIVRNRAIDALRRAAGSAPKLDFDDDGVLESLESGTLTDSEAIRRETAHRVRGALRELPNEQSEVIGLAYFGGFTHSEIAEMLGAPLGSVKGRLRLGLEKVRITLAEGMGADNAAEVLP
jgi:RNA polymerase sigma-70 factor (ECF subfamily)